MTKYHGKIGFIIYKEKDPGVWIEEPIERDYKGEIIRNFRRWDKSSDSINSDLNVTNSIEIIADDFMINNSHFLRYAEFMGSYWSVNSIELNRPRLILELGGVYHKQETSESSEESTPIIERASEKYYGER